MSLWRFRGRGSKPPAHGLVDTDISKWKDLEKFFGY